MSSRARANVSGASTSDRLRVEHEHRVLPRLYEVARVAQHRRDRDGHADTLGEFLVGERAEPRHGTDLMVPVRVSR